MHNHVNSRNSVFRLLGYLYWKIWGQNHTCGAMSLLSECRWVKPSGAHYNDVIMSAMASQITSLTIVYSTVYLGVDQRKHQSSASRAFVRGIHRGPVNSPHKGPVTRKMFSFDDVIMWNWDTYRIMYVLAWRTVYVLTRGLFWCLFPELRSNEGNKHQITLEWAHKQFVTRVHTLFYFLHDITNR